MYTELHDRVKIQSLHLFKDYQNTQSIELRNQLIELNFGLVKKEAYYWVNQCQESYEDLLQVGCLGLIRAIERFDVTKGNSFSTFAIPYIRGEIQHYLRDKGSPFKLPRRWLELRQQSLGLIKDFRDRFHRQPTDSEIAQGLEISLKEWQEIKLAYQNRDLLSLDVPVGDDKEGKTSLVDLVPDGHYRSFQLAQDDRIRLQQALSELEDRTRQVLEFVFLQDLTQKETAEQLGISVVTVARRVKKGLDWLKQSVNAEES